MAASRHVAFLRGIGPARKAPGDELRRCFRRAGYDEVVPVLATGNVIFTLPGRTKAPKPSAVEAMLDAHFGYAIPVVLRSQREIEAMFAEEPFRRFDPAAYMRFVCMLGEGARRVAAPKPPADAVFRVVGRSDDNLFLVRPIEQAGTPEMMAFLDKTFSSVITTRNWNTMEKIAALLAG